MVACDIREIDGCQVYSYEVVCPQRPHEAVRPVAPAKTLRQKTAVRRTKKTLLGLLMLLLLPFAFLCDLAAKAAATVARPMIRLYRRAPGTAGMISALSCASLMSVLLLAL